jgi:hypothetical protein
MKLYTIPIFLAIFYVIFFLKGKEIDKKICSRGKFMFPREDNILDTINDEKNEFSIIENLAYPDDDTKKKTLHEEYLLAYGPDYVRDTIGPVYTVVKH